MVVTGEFGRSPRITAGGGREHWPGAFSMLLAGAGTVAGRPIGGTDRDGAFPVDRPISPGAPTATVLLALGVDGSAEFGMLPQVPGPPSDDRPVTAFWS